MNILFDVRKLKRMFLLILIIKLVPTLRLSKWIKTKLEKE